MPLHPQVVAMLDKEPHPYNDPEVPITLAEARAFEEAKGGAHVLPPGVVVEERTLPGPAGGIPARIYRPSDRTPAGTVVWIRGGGFVQGSLNTDRVAPPLALASRCSVVSFEYRLAPEHPFPAGLDDCYAVLHWADENASELGRHGSVAVGGESAGGNLTAAPTLMARDRRGPDNALQVLLCPATAHRFEGGSRHNPELCVEGGPHVADLVFQLYLADPADGDNPLVSPLNAPTLAGLPPAVVVTAEYDAVRDEGEAYARRLEDEGVPVVQRRFEGMSHGFMGWLGKVDAAQKCLDLMGAAFREAVTSKQAA